MYSLEVRESVERIFSKLVKKNPNQMRIIGKKITQIRENPYHFKPLRTPMQHLRRFAVRIADKDKDAVLISPRPAPGIRRGRSLRKCQRWGAGLE